MYNVFVTNQCRKDLKNLSRDVQEFIRYSCFPIILKNPLIGEALKSKKFKGLLKFGIRFRGTDYRIVYEIENKRLVIFVIIASRENFYKKLKRRV